MSSIKKQTIIYYLVLYVALLFTWARQDFIPMPARIAYLVLVFAPVLVKRVAFYFPCLVLFLTTSLLSYAGYTFMPTEIIIYLLITLFFSATALSLKRNYRYPYWLFVLLLFLTVVINFIESYTIESVSYSFLFLILLPLTVSDNDKDIVVSVVPKVFIIATFSCALLILLNTRLISADFYSYDRLVSQSLNYTCCTLGIGFVFALRELVKPSTTKAERVFYAISIMVILFTVISEASRGATLAMILSSVIIIIGWQGSRRIKFFTIVVAAIFIFVLYNNQFFDLLVYRIQADTGTGSGRTEIWVEKYNKYREQITIGSALFGIGFENTWNLGGAGANYKGCHNDFLAFLIEYGVIGLVFFLTLIFYPLRAAKSRIVRFDIVPLVTYIIVVCLTLEPFSMGYLPFCFLLLFIYLRSCEQ